jgi:hypothetical protein
MQSVMCACLHNTLPLLPHMKRFRCLQTLQTLNSRMH